MHIYRSNKLSSQVEHLPFGQALQELKKSSNKFKNTMHIDLIDYVLKGNISLWVRPCKNWRESSNMQVEECNAYSRKHFDVSINFKRVIYSNVMTSLSILTYINEPPDQSR